MLERELEHTPAQETSFFKTAPEFIKSHWVAHYLELESECKTAENEFNDKETNFMLRSSVAPIILGFGFSLYRFTEHISWTDFIHSPFISLGILLPTVIVAAAMGIMAGAIFSVPLTWCMKKAGFWRKHENKIQKLKEQCQTIENKINEFFSKKKHQKQLLLDLAAYQLEADGVMGEGFSDFCNDYTYLKKELIAIFSREQEEQRDMWPYVKSVYQLSQTMNRQIKPFRLQARARAIFNQALGKDIIDSEVVDYKGLL